MANTAKKQWAKSKHSTTAEKVGAKETKQSRIEKISALLKAVSVATAGITKGIVEVTKLENAAAKVAQELMAKVAIAKPQVALRYMAMTETVVKTASDVEVKGMLSAERILKVFSGDWTKVALAVINKTDINAIVAGIVENNKASNANTALELGIREKELDARIAEQKKSASEFVTLERKLDDVEKMATIARRDAQSARDMVTSMKDGTAPVETEDEAEEPSVGASRIPVRTKPRVQKS